MIGKTYLRQSLGWYGSDSTLTRNRESGVIYARYFNYTLQLLEYIDWKVWHASKFSRLSIARIDSVTSGVLLNRSRVIRYPLGYSASARNSERWAGFVFRSPSMAEVTVSSPAIAIPRDSIHI